eukprot:TRINITY_DN35047_c0_g1_i1.p1 TRINITY_DN35047_c0_g1~~TRINITY_DN35047_c0_g1_i1.p1  ORF type:complete len:412 (-),score=88.21 TRINITY_DN35047_c0_g1_i1:184-1419(-)
MRWVKLVCWPLLGHLVAGLRVDEQPEEEAEELRPWVCKLKFCGTRYGNQILGNSDCMQVEKDVQRSIGYASRYDHFRPEFSKDSHMILIVPDAAYEFGGTVAAQGYLAAHAAGPFDVVVLAGFYHSQDSGQQWPNPKVMMGSRICGVGLDMLDDAAVAFLEKKLSAAAMNDTSLAGVKEHSLEQQMPFLQMTGLLTGSTKLIPVMMGSDEPQIALRLARAMEQLLQQEHWRNKRFLFVSSSDLSEHFDVKDEEKLDRRTAVAIDSEKPEDLIAFFEMQEREGDEAGDEHAGRQRFPSGRGPILFASWMADILQLGKRKTIAAGNSLLSKFADLRSDIGESKQAHVPCDAEEEVVGGYKSALANNDEEDARDVVGYAAIGFSKYISGHTMVGHVGSANLKDGHPQKLPATGG